MKTVYILTEPLALYSSHTKQNSRDVSKEDIIQAMPQDCNIPFWLDLESAKSEVRKRRIDEWLLSKRSYWPTELHEIKTSMILEVSLKKGNSPAALQLN